MNSLDLYGYIEPYLDFTESNEYLYKTFAKIVLSKDIKTLLDVGCGQGEFCYIMQLNGIKTFGIDLSSKQIEFAKQKNIDAKAIDISKVTQTFDCATAIFDVVNYLSYEQLEDFFAHNARVLNKNGYFIFDINNFFLIDVVAQGTLCLDHQDKFITLDAFFEDNQLNTHITLFEQTKNKRYTKTSGTITQQYHSNELLTNILNKVGFEIEELIPINLHSQTEPDKYIFVAKKNKNY